MVANPVSHEEVAAGRRNLMEVLAFLERRGASPAVLELAMVRSGITPDVARLLSQCMVSGELAPAPTASPTGPDATGDTSAKALRWIAQTVLVWGGLLVGGLGFGFVLGLEIGAAQGFEEGLDRIQTAFQLALQ